MSTLSKPVPVGDLIWPPGWIACLKWPPVNFKAVCQSTCLIFSTNADYNAQRCIQSSETPKFTMAQKKNITVTFVFILLLLFLPNIFLFAVVDFDVFDD